nr:MAG TPA: hypothetical protein [Caudoviricetes sp.]
MNKTNSKALYFSPYKIEGIVVSRLPLYPLFFML